MAMSSSVYQVWQVVFQGEKLGLFQKMLHNLIKNMIFLLLLPLLSDIPRFSEIFSCGIVYNINLLVTDFILTEL